MSKIFLSYRRADSPDMTDRIYRALLPVYGAENIFRDLDSIPGGVDFRVTIRQKLDECQVTLVIIGPIWLSELHRRINDPVDYVREEVGQSLSRQGGIRVFPLLVGGASMPTENQLPSNLAQLAFQNARPVQRDPYFDFDMQRVINDITSLIPVPKGNSKEAIRGKALLEQSKNALLRGDYMSAERDLQQAETLIYADELPFEAAQVRYFQALVRLNGRRPFTLALQTMRSVESLMNSALSLHRSASYLLVLAVFKRDFAKNGLTQLISESRQLTAEAGQVGLNEKDQDNLLVLSRCQPDLFRDYFSS